MRRVTIIPSEEALKQISDEELSDLFFFAKVPDTEFNRVINEMFRRATKSVGEIMKIA